MTTTKFADLTIRVAGHLQAPDCRVVVVDHPLGGTDPATVVSWADAAVDRVLAAFTGRQAEGA
jgi:hypothetical protein